MTKNMCVYPISEAPYLAISNVRKMSRKGRCLIEDTRGHLKKVNPMYVGPFDSDKLLKFGALVSQYIVARSDAEKDFSCKSNSIFDTYLARA